MWLTLDEFVAWCALHARAFSYSVARVVVIVVGIDPRDSAHKTMRKVAIFLMLVSAAVLVVLVISTVVIVREFVIRSDVIAKADDLPTTGTTATTAIVFTGQFDRIELALQLFDQGQLDRIFISGVNGGAGIAPDRFADQFRLSSNARAALDAGRIVLAPDANTTIENALEAACWLDRQSDIREIVLITGQFHMPRASWALESALTRPVRVRRLSPETPSAVDVRLRSNMHERMPELLRFVATVPLALIPRLLWPAESPRACM